MRLPSTAPSPTKRVKSSQKPRALSSVRVEPCDMRMSLPQEQRQCLGSTEAELQHSYIEYPTALSEGQSLKDAYFEMNVKESSGMGSKISYKAVNRKVEGKEKVTSPAGSWDAYTITCDASFRMQVSGVGIPTNMKVTEWIVPGFGIVKTVS